MLSLEKRSVLRCAAKFSLRRRAPREAARHRRTAVRRSSSARCAKSRDLWWKERAHTDASSGRTKVFFWCKKEGNVDCLLMVWTRRGSTAHLPHLATLDGDGTCVPVKCACCSRCISSSIWCPPILRLGHRIVHCAEFRLIFLPQRQHQAFCLATAIPALEDAAKSSAQVHNKLAAC